MLLGANQLPKQDPVAPKDERIPVKDSLHNPADTSYVFRQMTQFIPSWKVKYPVKPEMFLFPLDSNFGLSGTFAELRSNHFHAGLDLRTGGVEGKKVMAAANGTVVRIKVSTRGYGKVLYVQHSNGYQTVYGHLSQFNAEIEEYVRNRQYKQKKVEIELYPPAGKINVKRGETIAFSGNTGGSGGPHLHFETRYQNGKSVNPAFFNFPPDDEINPIIKHVVVFDESKNTRESHGGLPYQILNSKHGKSFTLKLDPGKYSVGAHWNDYYRDKFNKLGVNRAVLKVNGAVRFQYFQPDFSFSQGRYINAHIDYRLKKTIGFPVVRLHETSFNPLQYYTSIENGKIDLLPRDSLKLEIWIWDEAGNADSVSINILAGDQSTRFENTTIEEADTAIYWSHSSSKSFQVQDNFKFKVPAQTFYHAVVFRFKESPQGVYHVGNAFYPMHRYGSISVKLPKNTKPDRSWCILYREGKSWVYEGGQISDGWVTTKIRTLGTYKLGQDATKPSITFLKNKNKTWWFKLLDDFSGIGLIETSIDGKWLVYDFEPKTGILKVEMPLWIKVGDYTLKIKVEDRCSNRTVLNKKVKIH